MVENKVHEFSLGTFALKSKDKDINKIEQAIFEMFDKLQLEGIITNDPREYHKPSNDFVEPDRVMSFYLY